MATDDDDDDLSALPGLQETVGDVSSSSLGLEASAATRVAAPASGSAIPSAEMAAQCPRWTRHRKGDKDGV